MKTLLALLLLISSLSWGDTNEITNLSCISDDKSMDVRVKLRLGMNRASVNQYFIDRDLFYNDDYIKIKAKDIEYDHIFVHLNIDRYSGRAIYNLFFSDSGESTTPVQLTCKKLTEKKF